MTAHWSLIYDPKGVLHVETEDFGDSQIRGVSLRRANGITPVEIRAVTRRLADLMIAELDKAKSTDVNRK